MNLFRSVIREAAADHPDAPMRELARHVLKLLPADTRDDAIEIAIAAYVADTLRADRCDALNTAFRPHRTPARSPKVQERADWWQTLLDSRVSVGDAWKALGDCTVADLRYCIAERESKVAQIEQQIGHYRVLIAAMHQTKATIVAEIPRDAIEGLSK